MRKFRWTNERFSLYFSSQTYKFHFKCSQTLKSKEGVTANRWLLTEHASFFKVQCGKKTFFVRLKIVIWRFKWDDDKPIKCVFCVLPSSARMNIAGTLVFSLSVLFPLITGRIGHSSFGTNRVSNSWSVPSDSSKPQITRSIFFILYPRIFLPSACFRRSILFVTNILLKSSQQEKKWDCFKSRFTCVVFWYYRVHAYTFNVRPGYLYYLLIFLFVESARNKSRGEEVQRLWLPSLNSFLWRQI